MFIKRHPGGAREVHNSLKRCVVERQCYCIGVETALVMKRAKSPDMIKDHEKLWFFDTFFNKLLNTRLAVLKGPICKAPGHSEGQRIS